MLGMVIVSFIGVVLYLGCLAWHDITRDSYNVISVGRVDRSYDYLVKLENSQCELISYRGSSTVWRNVDTGKRASTTMELMLSDIYTKHKWKETENER